MKRRKMRKKEEIKQFERKRGRILQARFRIRDRCQFEVPAARRIWAYTERVLSPILFADVARRMGNHSVSPRDFHCGCGPCYKDGLPICEGRKVDCRFADRCDAEELVVGETNDDFRSYHFKWETALGCYSGGWRPKSVLPLRRK